MTPTPSAWRYTHQDKTMRFIGYSYEDVKPKNCNHPAYVGLFTAGQLNQYGQSCFEAGVSSVYTPDISDKAVLQQALDALVIAEAGLADIGDADREPGDDLAWCEARAAQALKSPRVAIIALRATIAQLKDKP